MVEQNFDLEKEISEIIHGINLAKHLGQKDTFFVIDGIESGDKKQIIDHSEKNGFRVTIENHNKIEVFWD